MLRRIYRWRMAGWQFKEQAPEFILYFGTLQDLPSVGINPSTRPMVKVTK